MNDGEEDEIGVTKVGWWTTSRTVGRVIATLVAVHLVVPSGVLDLDVRGGRLFVCTGSACATSPAERPGKGQLRGIAAVKSPKVARSGSRHRSLL
jgi:hypothetical protein